MQPRLPTVDTQDKLTRLEQRSLNTRPTQKLPTMPSEYVLFCGLHFIKMSNDKDILPANTQEQERELWLTSSSFRLRFCAQHENIENCTQYSILCPKKLRSGVIKLRTRASWLAPELFLLHLLSTTTSTNRQIC